MRHNSSDVSDGSYIRQLETRGEEPGPLLTRPGFKLFKALDLPLCEPRSLCTFLVPV